MDGNHDSAKNELLLAEFSALRAEILQRSSLQWNVFALQLTAAGVVFSFALSNPSHTGFLLILPIITYALTGRYASQVFGTQKIATYIREVLEVRANGELHWEEWQRVRPPKARTLTWLNPLFLGFPGVAIIALAWVAPYVWASTNTPTGKRILIVAIWFIGVLVTALSFQLVARVVSRHWHGTWLHKISQIPRRTKPGGESAESPDKTLR